MQTKVQRGVVRDAIIAYLSQRDCDASVAEIEAAVKDRLDQEVAPTSIRSYLSMDKLDLFVRTARGRYRLRDAPEQSTLFQPQESQKLTKFESGLATLYKSNCFDWLESQPESSIHAVVTDPPYGLVEYSKAEKLKLHRGKGGVWRIPPAFDGNTRSPLPRFTVLKDKDLDQLRTFFFDWTRRLIPVLVPGANVVVASNPLLSYLVASAIVDAGLERRGELIRLVMTMRGGDRPKNAHQEYPDISVMPRSMWEPWLLFRKPLDGKVQDNLRKWGTGGFRRPEKDKPFGDVIRSAPTHKSEKQLAPHPSLKPQRFLRQLVSAVLPLGKGIILDPFAGSGSTLAACNHCKLKSVGIEEDTRFFKIACTSIPKLSELVTNQKSL